MASTFDSSPPLNHHEDEENQPISLPVQASSTDVQEPSEKIDEQQSEETDVIESNATDPINLENMATAEASFTDATSADIPVGATHSSVARILVKRGQIFRVQVDNEVKEVHGKSPFPPIINSLNRRVDLSKVRVLSENTRTKLKGTDSVDRCNIIL